MTTEDIHTSSQISGTTLNTENTNHAVDVVRLAYDNDAEQKASREVAHNVDNARGAVEHSEATEEAEGSDAQAGEHQEEADDERGIRGVVLGVGVVEAKRDEDVVAASEEEEQDREQVAQHGEEAHRHQRVACRHRVERGGEGARRAIGVQAEESGFVEDEAWEKRAPCEEEWTPSGSSGTCR
eukprot:CAMPEP_0113273072 /NCGR_PEP_ID=MMETSP0008_2-20120614/23652_1 /TAXON_ID=97485 /ORGANISM="Prymnesium parvum" /LENGTH=182 /DNA_ID=CAMNT_0000122557 /DNA_START=161 /DNA_END=708 /DNA_ORIENTATION=+ /assembly_acc=CAM_ASM_000153